MARARRAWRVAAVGVLLAIGLGTTLWFLALDPAGYPPRPVSPATLSFYDSHGALLYEALDPEQGTSTYVPLRDLPSHLLHATVATEDASFYTNPGVDPGAILRALVQNLRSEDIVSGGSTITQQLARNLYMSPAERADRSIVRKVRESILALRLVARLGKHEVLEWYLNTAPYGHQAVGAEAAARVYFGKRARDLDLAECALLAGLPQAPSSYDPLLDLPAAKARQRTVLALMARHGFITEEEAEAAAAEPLQFAPAPFPVRAPHFVAYAQGIVVNNLGLDAASLGPLRVFTTLDLGLQETAEQIVQRHVASLRDKGVTNGALVALDPRTGEVLAMVGSADYFEPSIDGQVNVVLASRQPGSAIKPVLYAAALERGFTLASVLYDVPTSYLTADGKAYAPENYDRIWHGPVSLRDSLANSLNLPTVGLLQQVGVPSFLDAATRAGLTALSSKGTADLSLALGSGEVRLLDLASAYGALAAGGTGREPAVISRVEDARGRVLWRADETRLRRFTTPQVAFLITSILSDNDARSPSFGSDSPLRLSRPAAAKTGTTTDWRDNWTVGYTPDLVAGVWVGNADNSPMLGVSGVSGAAPIWHDFMEEALKGLPAAAFQEPGGLVRREVCAVSGDLPSKWCPHRRSELFVAGTEPATTCEWHRAYRIDSRTGLPADEDTPPERAEDRVFLLLPAELQAWGRQRGVPDPPEWASPEEVAPAPVGPRLVLTSPHDRVVLQISGEVPLETQKLEVAAAGPGLVGSRVELSVDGAVLASFDGAPYRATWQLVPGRHVFSAVALDARGEAIAHDEATITVEQQPSGP